MSKMNSKQDLIFSEEQKFSQWWMWIFISIPFAIGLFGSYKQLIRGEVFGDRPMSDLGLIIFTLIGLGLIIFFWSHKLTTRLDEEGISVHFFPYTKKFHSWKEIDYCEVIAYEFVGGWGIRLWTKYGTVYNVQQGEGLFVQLKNKKKFLVGTQNPEKMTEIIKLLQVN